MSVLLVALLALQAPLDDGTLVIHIDTAEVARESFRVAAVHGGTQGGWTVASTVRFDRTRSSVVLAPILEVSSDSQPESLEFDVADARRPQRILGQSSRGRFTVRLLGRGTERAREFPIAGRTVVLDDSVFALYVFAAWQAGPRPVEVTALVPRSGRRETLSIEDLGPGPATLRHIRISGGTNQVVEVWLDRDGRLHRIEIPSRRVRVERLPPA